MNTRFKGMNHPIQSLAVPSLTPPYLRTPGAKVTYNGEDIGVVDSVTDDEVVVKLNPGCEEKFRALLDAPHKAGS
jgi:hypothetical protein